MKRDRAGRKKGAGTREEEHNITPTRALELVTTHIVTDRCLPVFGNMYFNLCMISSSGHMG